MKIKPLKGEIYIKIDEATAGVLDTSSRESAVEFAEVISVGEGVEEVKKGDKIFVKSWAIDILNHAGKKYLFVNLATKGIKAIVQ